MILAACRFFAIDPAQVHFIGDHDTDMEAARRAGCKGIRICRDVGGSEAGACKSGERAYSRLFDAVLDLYGEDI